MKITEVTTYTVFAGWRNWLFVKIDTDEGVHGVGEGTLEGKEHAVAGAIKDLSYYLVGKDPAKIRLHLRNMRRDPFWRGGVVLTTAISAVEIALWDIAGKVNGKPVYALLGGAVNEELPAYANGWYFGAKSPEEFAERAAGAVKMGYRGLKWDPFRRADLEISRDDFAFAVDCVRAVRDAVGPGVDLLIEGHGRFTPAAAVKIARALEPFDIFWFEEPTPPENLRALKKTAERSPIPVATGERLYTKEEFARLLELQAADYIQPDVVHAGGILELREIAAMAEPWYVQVAPHNPNGPVAMAATLHAAATMLNLAYIEHLMADPPWRATIVTQDFSVERNGKFRLPEGPGLGIDLNVEELERHPYRPVFLNFFSESSVLEKAIHEGGR